MSTEYFVNTLSQSLGGGDLSTAYCQATGILFQLPNGHETLDPGDNDIISEAKPDLSYEG